ncbi:YbjN domain-containing protein [Aeromonas cavernicola]|nr:YbjN domain-containing protein [Aeromonas cavernicola]
MMNIPSSEMIMRWLQQARIEHYICDQCHGIHVVSLQSVDGVQESRIFVEEEGLLFSSELELRPSALLSLVAELGRLNMEYPSLKIFLDVVDDNLPRLVVGHTVFTKAGLSAEQFVLFVQSTIAATHELVAECERLGVLNVADAAEIDVSQESVH